MGVEPNLALTNTDNTDLNRIFRGTSGVESYKAFRILIEV
jgi:hypothetical protein